MEKEKLAERQEKQFVTNDPKTFEHISTKTSHRWNKSPLAEREDK